MQSELQSGRTQVVAVRPDPSSRQIDVTLIGARLTPTALSAVQARLGSAGLEHARLTVHQAEDQKVDVAALRTDLLADFYRQSQLQLAERERSIAALRSELAQRDSWQAAALDIATELKAQLPQCGQVLAGQAWRTVDGEAPKAVPFVSARCGKAVKPAEHARIERWLQARAHAGEVRLQLEFDGTRRKLR